MVPPLRFPKQRLRRELKARRTAHVASLSRAERCAAYVMLRSVVAPHLDKCTVVAVYLPIGSEIDPLPIIDLLQTRGKRLLLPHVTGRRGAMRFLDWTPGDPLDAGPMGLLQPHDHRLEREPDLILAPLLGFDRQCNRLGYGAGHYDRAFARFPAARRVGLAWSVSQVDDVPSDSWDVPLHAVATEQGWTAV